MHPKFDKPTVFHTLKLLKINQITTENYNENEKVNRNRDDDVRGDNGGMSFKNKVRG